MPPPLTTFSHFSHDSSMNPYFNNDKASLFDDSPGGDDGDTTGNVVVVETPFRDGSSFGFNINQEASCNSSNGSIRGRLTSTTERNASGASLPLNNTTISSNGARKIWSLRDLLLQEPSNDGMQIITNTSAAATSSESTFPHKYFPTHQYHIFNFLPSYLLHILSHHGIQVARFTVWYRENYQSLNALGAAAITQQMSRQQRNLRDHVSRYLLVDMNSVQRDAKKYHKLWFRGVFGMQYFAVWECSLKWMRRRGVLCSASLDEVEGGAASSRRNRSTTALEAALQNLSLEPNKNTHTSIPPFFPLLHALDQLRQAHVCILMCHGGYFAAGVWRNGSCILHKTFHAYVVRKQQGRRQVSRDKSKRGRSVGAEIRRQNEAHFHEKLTKLLAEWRSHFEECSLILASAPGPINRSYLFGEDSPLRENDERMHTLPFHLDGNPNHQMVLRVWEKLVKWHAVYSSTPPSTEGLLSVAERQKLFDLSSSGVDDAFTTEYD